MSDTSSAPRQCDYVMSLLKECLLRSDCVLKQNRLPSDCLRNHIDELPQECRLLRQAHYDCKRGLLDMRLRFRGNNVGGSLPLQEKREADFANGGR
ncbi:hypothetical protein FRB94_011421 [Tulasnella sp. JGI-2019a]|nr:hypothetical protein FRB94_011421 [Tulasnella sp. JGI-2019a]